MGPAGGDAGPGSPCATTVFRPSRRKCYTRCSTSFNITSRIVSVILVDSCGPNVRSYGLNLVSVTAHLNGRSRIESGRFTYVRLVPILLKKSASIVFCLLSIPDAEPSPLG